nr:hypothetical protein P5660_18155 [Bacillus velezensis]
MGRTAFTAENGKCRKTFSIRQRINGRRNLRPKTKAKIEEKL